MTGNDSWDVTTNLGTTALGVAAQRAAETAQNDPLFRDEFAAVLVAAVEEPGWQMMASGDLSWMGPEDDDGRRAATSGRDYVASRTVHFDDFLAAAVTAGIRQVVILAAGLDARSYRLNSLSGVVVYEVDQPNVLGFKHTVLRAHGAVPVADMRAVPVDLRDDEVLVDQNGDRVQNFPPLEDAAAAHGDDRVRDGRSGERAKSSEHSSLCVGAGGQAPVDDRVERGVAGRAAPAGGQWQRPDGAQPVEHLGR